MLEEIKMNLDKEIKLILENAGVNQPILTDEMKKEIDKFVEKYMSVNPYELESFKHYDEPPEDYWDDEEELYAKYYKLLGKISNSDNHTIWWELTDSFDDKSLEMIDEHYEQFKNEVREYVQSKVDDYESYTHEYYY
jgi:hypothetical protein